MDWRDRVMKNISQRTGYLCLFLVFIFSMLAFSSFPVANAKDDKAGDYYDGDYCVISNESMDPGTSADIGTYSAVLQNKGGTIAPKCQFIPTKAAEKPMSASLPLAATKSKLGDTRNFKTNSYRNGSSEVKADLVAIGKYVEVWVCKADFDISTAQANQIRDEFDQKIYPKVTDNFGKPSDIDGNGKVVILMYDIADNYGVNGSTDSFAGFFIASDLQKFPGSNACEMFYIDTYPTLGLGKEKDITVSYPLIAHELGHMVNYVQNVMKEKGGGYSQWMEEGMGDAAQQAYTGKLWETRIHSYNTSNAIRDGLSLTNFQYANADNYALSYFFLEYLKKQAGIGEKVFGEIAKSQYEDYRAIEEVIHKFIDPKMSFAQFTTQYRVALLLKDKTGPYGFKGDADFDRLKVHVFSGYNAKLPAGGAVVVMRDLVTKLIFVPKSKPDTLKYVIIKDGKVSKAPPVVITPRPMITLAPTTAITPAPTTDIATPVATPVATTVPTKPQNSNGIFIPIAIFAACVLIGGMVAVIFRRHRNM